MNTLQNADQLYNEKNLRGLEIKLDVIFKNKDLLIQAVSRKAYVKELRDKYPDCSRQDNERLEFLGDSVLELIIRKHLYKTLSDGEDVLTPTCSEIVKRRSLAKVAFGFGLDEHLFLTSSEEDNLRRKPRILADSLEALIGAVFLETNFYRTTEIVLNRIYKKYL